jgi:hypothetical protein
MERLFEGVPTGSHGLQVMMSNICDNSRWIHASPAFLNFDVSDSVKYGKAAFSKALLENAAYQVLGEMENIADVYGAHIGLRDRHVPQPGRSGKNVRTLR